MTRNALLLLSGAVVLAAGCGGDDGGGPPPVPTAAEVLAAGWDAFETGDLAGAEASFRELLARGELRAEAHDGLGWRFAYGAAPDSAAAHFARARDAGAEDLPIADEVRAGVAVAADALGGFAAVLAATAAVADPQWAFAHDAALDHDDLVVLRAVAHYALGDFAASLAEVRRLDATFTADVDTPAGRAALAAKIEDLRS